VIQTGCWSIGCGTGTFKQDVPASLCLALTFLGESSNPRSWTTFKVHEFIPTGQFEPFQFQYQRTIFTIKAINPARGHFSYSSREPMAITFIKPDSLTRLGSPGAGEHDGGGGGGGYRVHCILLDQVV